VRKPEYFTMRRYVRAVCRPYITAILSVCLSVCHIRDVFENG